MADFTEDELLNALDGEAATADTPDSEMVEDLKEEEAPAEPEPAEEPAQEHAEPETPAEPEPAEEPEAPAEPEPAEEAPAEAPKELILGKFKSQEDLVKAYQNLEKRFGEKSKEVKEVAQVTTDEFDTAVRTKIQEESWKLVEKAFDTIGDPEQAKDAQFLLSQFKKTGNAEYLEKARGFLDARIDRRLEVDTMNTAAYIQQQANAHRQEILLKPLSDELDKMEEEDPDFMHDEENQNLMSMAIKLNPATVDVRAVKKAIEGYRKSAYDKGYEAARKEFAKQAEKKTVSVKSSGHVEAPAPKKPSEALTIEEQLEEEMQNLF